MRASIILSTAALALAVTVSAAPPEGKGGGKGGEDSGPAYEVPTTVFVERQRRSPPRLVVAGDDSSKSQPIYQYENYAAYLHDAVLLADGHGRALITDRSDNPLPMILVEFWFDVDGKVTNSTSTPLVLRPDWGCEALSSDGTRAIYFDRNNSQVNVINLANGNINGLVFSDPSQSFSTCDFESDDPLSLNGVLYATVRDSSGARIDRIDISAASTRTVYGPTGADLRDFSIHYNGSDVSAVAISEDYTIRLGSSFSEAGNAPISISSGTEADFYCNGERLLFRGRVKNKRVTQIYDSSTGTTAAYVDDAEPNPRTLC
jgi:hypothetical protein